MEEIFIFNIIDYFKEDEFMNKISFLCKNNKINQLRKKINQKRSILLFHNLFNYKKYSPEFIETYLEDEVDYSETLKDVIEDLLDETMLERAHLTHINQHYIVYKKHCISNTIYNYTQTGLINNINFDAFSLIHSNIKLCSTYRLPNVQKNILIKHYPHAKALIY